MISRHVLPVFGKLGSACNLYKPLLKGAIQRSGGLEHVAIIQDGNRRYARREGISKLTGHNLGAKTTDRVADWCLDLGIKHLTVYTFSTENFKRDEEEKRYLFELIRNKLLELSTSERVHQNQVRVRAIGRIELMPRCVQEAAREAEEATRGYDNMYFNLALAYGGRCELVDATRSLAAEVKEGRLKPAEVDAFLIYRHLYPPSDQPLPKVDLVIRTGGEVRTSNFLPWQANGSECAAYFCAPYWPEFSEMDFLKAVRIAQARKKIC